MTDEELKRACEIMHQIFLESLRLWGNNYVMRSYKRMAGMNVDDEGEEDAISEVDV